MAVYVVVRFVYSRLGYEGNIANAVSGTRAGATAYRGAVNNITTLGFPTPGVPRGFFEAHSAAHSLPVPRKGFN